MAKKQKHKHNEEEGGEAWLLPYSDLMTLLLAVFIVLFAVSKVDQKQAEQLAQAFREDMMTGEAGPLSGDGDTAIPLNPDNEMSPNLSREELEKYLGKSELENLEELESKVDDVVQNEELTSYVTTVIDSRGLIISMNNAVLFDSGSAEIKSESEGILLRIGKVLNTLNNYIRIEGHTDNVPIKSSDYPSNWELSTARASSVVRLLIDECDVTPEKLVAVGYGEYKPIAHNSTEEGRAKNRRIDIIILSEKYNNLEKQITE